MFLDKHILSIFWGWTYEKIEHIRASDWKNIIFEFLSLFRNFGTLLFVPKIDQNLGKRIKNAASTRFCYKQCILDKNHLLSIISKVVTKSKNWFKNRKILALVGKKTKKSFTYSNFHISGSWFLARLQQNMSRKESNDLFSLTPFVLSNLSLHSWKKYSWK